MDNYILLRTSEVDAIEAQALQKKDINKDRPMSESSIEAQTCLDIIKWVRDNNLYTKSLGCDKRYINGKR